MDKKTSLPSTAFQFLAPAGIGQATDTNERTLTGIAYSGDIITDHGYWSRLVIDLDTLSIETPIPLLLGHDHEETVGMVTTATTLAGNLGIEAALFTDVDEKAAEVAAKADKGFPWQLSVGIWPNSIEDVPAGNTISLNGKTFQGPLSIFRGGRIREVSVVAIGADHRTSATVLNAGDHFEIPIITHEDNTVTIEELNAKLQAVEAENNQLKTDLHAAQAAKTEAEQSLHTFKATARANEIEALSAKLGKTFSEDEVTQFKALPDAAFSFMAGQLAAAKPKTPEHLFREQATGGQESSTYHDAVTKLTAQVQGV